MEPRGLGEDLVAGLGDEHGVLPLRRQAVVLGDDGPAVGELADAGLPALIIGSTVKVMPGSSRRPVPGWP